LVAVAWVLNLDADDELRDPQRAPARATGARAREWAPRAGLIAPGDVLIEPGVRVDGLPGRAWMPTTRALAELADAGAVVPAAPPFAVLRTVNDRAFAATLGIALPGATVIRTIDEANALEQPPPAGARSWRLERSHGFAGRGARVVDRRPTPRDIAWIRSSLPVYVEPLVDRIADFALHGHLDPAGHAAFGEPTLQRCDARGAWRGSARAAPSDLDPAERSALAGAAEKAARALAAAGYFGPFGIDAFRWRDDRDTTHFHPLCDLNARYTMGWAIGMGDRRPDRP
jgi:hypothetical protein